MKIKFTPFIFAFAGIIFFFATRLNAQAINRQDSLALVDLYNNTNGPAWNNHANWLTATPVSTWAGITVSGDRVTWIAISTNNLQGQLPTSIGKLTALQYLVLDFNQLTGTIPPAIGNLINLLQLQLYKNQFTGTVPASFTKLTKLQWLQLQFNQLSGKIPVAVCNIPSLQILKLDDNQFSGRIPDAIDRLTNLVILDLSDNQLTGPIPDSITTLSLLGELDLFGNQLSGRIPASIGHMNVQTLSLNNNQLSGPIPSEIGNLFSTSFLNLQDNKLSGDLPTTILSLHNLSQLDISGNQLTLKQNVNFDLSGLPFLGTLNFSTNKFTFNGIESIAATYHHKFTYSPQATIPVRQHGTTLMVAAGGTTGNNTYTWFEVGKTTSTVIVGDSTFQPAESGRYFARIKNAVATHLTLSTDTITYSIPLATTGIDAAIGKTVTSSLIVYPNPVTGNVLHIQLNGNANITITNASGRILLTKQVNGLTTIATTSFAKGLYYIKNNNTGETKQFEVMQ